MLIDVFSGYNKYLYFYDAIKIFASIKYNINVDEWNLYKNVAYHMAYPFCILEIYFCYCG